MKYQIYSGQREYITIKTYKLVYHQAKTQQPRVMMLPEYMAFLYTRIYNSFESFNFQCHEEIDSRTKEIYYIIEGADDWYSRLSTMLTDNLSTIFIEATTIAKRYDTENMSNQKIAQLFCTYLIPQMLFPNECRHLFTLLKIR